MRTPRRRRRARLRRARRSVASHDYSTLHHAQCLFARTPRSGRARPETNAGRTMDVGLIEESRTVGARKRDLHSLSQKMRGRDSALESQLVIRGLFERRREAGSRVRGTRRRAVRAVRGARCAPGRSNAFHDNVRPNAALWAAPSASFRPRGRERRGNEGGTLRRVATRRGGTRHFAGFRRDKIAKSASYNSRNV